MADAKQKEVFCKPWSSWDLPEVATENDTVKLRLAYKPKAPDKVVDHCNRLPKEFQELYGNGPLIEFYSVAQCPACSTVVNSQSMSNHYKRDSDNNVVCGLKEMIIVGNKTVGKALAPFYEIKESKLPRFSWLIPTIPPATSSSSYFPYSQPIGIPQLSPRHKIHKTDHVSGSSSKLKSSSTLTSSSSSSHSKKHSSSSNSTSNSSKHKSSSKSSSSSAWGSSSSKKDSKSHKSHSSGGAGSYVLSIPSDDSHNDLDSIIMTGSPTKQTVHIVTGKSSKYSSAEPEYEQLKFYADSSEKKSSKHADSTDSKPHKSHFSTHLENFKIPLKNKSSSNSESLKKQKSSSHSHSSSSSSLSKPSSNESSLIKALSASAASSNATITVRKPAPSLTIISEAPKLSIPIVSSHSELKQQKSTTSLSSGHHSKKKKKKKTKDEPRKVIPLKERAFNPNTHCGVIAVNGQPCTRSLTCKTHSVALRRAVPGRSHGFDLLLAAHKKARDEEKVKRTGKEVIEEVKTARKSVTGGSHLASTFLLDSDSSNSSTPLLPIATKASSGGGKSSHTSSHKLSNSSGKKEPISSNSVAGSKSGGSHNHHHHRPVTSSTAAISSATKAQLQPPKEVPKSTAPLSSIPTYSTVTTTPTPQVPSLPPISKPTTRPLLFVDEVVDSRGPSIFELKREPENKFLCVASIKQPKNGVLSNLSSESTSRNTALSEWNPSDRFLPKKSNSAKKKVFKDPLISILPYITRSSTTGTDTQRNTVAPDVGVVPSADSRSSHVLASSLKSSDLKRSSCDASNASARGIKKSRLLSSPRQFYESMLLKFTSRNNDTPRAPLPVRKATTVKQESMSRPTSVPSVSTSSSATDKSRQSVSTPASSESGVVGEENIEVVQTAIDMIKAQLNDIGFTPKETSGDNAKKNTNSGITATTFFQSLHPSSLQFVEDLVRHQTKKGSTEKLSCEEMCQKALELSDKCIIS